ncbi:hypothetical protein [Paraburkholderia graminis]|uniref:Vacuolar-type H+-ATPase subunit I/STV1 n=1 Tax=Paraburkholderia graminis TaxID=60548 RepID=A0ABD5CJ72_9BURK|nr:hypothetical protein [Paraburkholderia graminis]MDR6205361.1 vacuolar-type H+-ATPase subunit I/STV1 [Paraburkholderia graminis]
MNTGLEEYKDAEYDRLTAALKAALLEIRSDPRLRATVAQVARMANCSRQQLYNEPRSWVVRRIKRIALSRKLSEKKESQTVEPNGVDDDSALQMLKEMRRENSQLFHDKRALLKQLEAARDEIKQLSRDLKSCEEELYELREQVKKASTPSSLRRTR